MVGLLVDMVEDPELTLIRIRISFQRYPSGPGMASGHYGSAKILSTHTPRTLDK